MINLINCLNYYFITFLSLYIINLQNPIIKPTNNKNNIFNINKMKKNFLDKLTKLLQNQSQNHNHQHNHNHSQNIHTPFEQLKNQFIKNTKEHKQHPHTSRGFDKFLKHNKSNQKQSKSSKPTVQNIIKSIWQKPFNQNISSFKETMISSTKNLNNLTKQDAIKSLNQLKNKSQILFNKQQLQQKSKKFTQMLQKTQQKTMNQLKNDPSKLFPSKQSINENLQKLQSRSKEVNSFFGQKLKTKSQQTSQLWGNNKQNIKNGFQSSKQQFARKAAQFQKNFSKASQKTLQKLKQSTDVKKSIKKSIDYIFWRICLLFGTIAFCYGLGSSLPKLVKHLISQSFSQSGSEQKEPAQKLTKSRF